MPSEPIAIVGLGCRFPGAQNPQAFWNLLCNGVDAITEIPPSRWDATQFYAPDPTQPGKTNVRAGGFLDNIDRFDATFFGIAPREAVTMDPQQRILLELAWEALEDAGLVPEQWRGSRTGVYVGIGTHDYSIRLWQYAIDDPYGTTGTGNCIAANRISYCFDFKGPSLAIDTACSSSLVAVHLACQSLQTGESDMALAGGVNALLVPTVTIGFSKGGFMSATGRCQSFDASADGYVRSEGAGVVVLKRLGDAVAAGDRIYGVIRGSAVNQDGLSNGMAAPNPRAQEAVLRAAYRQAQVDPAQVQYIEAHGTGTKIGDPIEMEALGSVLQAGRPDGLLCKVGSVKTNIGHCETAAGIAGLIKVALMLHHRQLLPSLHFRQPNPAIAFERLPIRVQTQLEDWAIAQAPTTGDPLPRLAGINSFGFGGTNAHVVLEEWAEGLVSAAVPAEEALEDWQILPLSAKTDAALKAQIDQYQRFLAEHPDVALADLCAAASRSRSHFSHRWAIAANSRNSLQAALAEGAIARSSKPDNVAFLFTGQGSQYPGMGRDLYGRYAVFRGAIDACAGILDGLLDVPLLELLDIPTAKKARRKSTAKRGSKATDPVKRLEQTAYTQPALFAVEYALATLWQAWGVQPSFVLGHSIGEWVAACVAGVLDLEDALRLVAARGRLMQAIPATGGMMAVMADEATVQPFLAEVPEVTIAALNSPQNTVLSGAIAHLDQLTTILEEAGIKATRLAVSHAFHSSLMEPMVEEFRAIAQQIHYHTPQIPLLSNVTGSLLELPDDADAWADYWCQHICQPVRFAQSIETLQTLKPTVLLECGAKPTLLGMARLTLERTENQPAPSTIHLLPSLRPPQPEAQPLLHTLATLYQAGISISWEAVYPTRPERFVPLPTYPFQRQRFWWEPPSDRPPALGTAPPPPAPVGHPLIGTPLPLAGTSDLRYQTQLSPQSPAYLVDHQVFGQVICPAAAFVEMGLAVATALKLDGAALQAFAIEQPLRLAETPTLTQITAKPNPDGQYTLEMFSQADSGFRRHWRTTLAAIAPTPAPAPLATLQTQLANHPVDVATYYDHLKHQNLDYGPAFQTIQQLWQGSGAALAELRLPAGVIPGAHRLHPALLDGAFQTLAAALSPQGTGSLEEPVPYLPTQIEALWSGQVAGDRLWSYVQVQPMQPNGSRPAQLRADLWLWDTAGTLVAQVAGLILTRPQGTDSFKEPVPWEKEPVPLAPAEEWLYEVGWEKLPPITVESSGQRRWLVFVPVGRIGEAIVNGLREMGNRPILVTPGDSFQALSPDHFTCDPQNPETFRQLLKAVDIASLTGILQGWSLDPAAQEISVAQRLGVASVLHLVQALVAAKSQPPLWLLTQGAQAVSSADAIAPTASFLWGLGRVIRMEYPQWDCRNIDLETGVGLSLEGLWAELSAPTGEAQVALRKGDRFGARLHRAPIPQPSIPDVPFRLQLSDYGVLDNLTLAPMQRRSPAPGEVEIQVGASGVNFRDVLNALGMLKPYLEQMGFASADQVPFGGECAGRVLAVGDGVTGLAVGDHVLAAQAVGSLSQYVTVDARFVVSLPPDLSLAAAATIPTTFLTAYYGLCQLAHLKPGESVLIHAAAGGVGMAAVQLAQRIGATVYATASPGKWDFLKKLGVKAVMNSRTLDFAEDLMIATAGRGVDVVLNSLNGDFIPKSLEVLASDGRFVEIGKIGIWDAEQVAALRPDITYFPFDLLEVSKADPDCITEMLKTLIPAFQDGSLQPLPYTAFPIEHAANAFRYMGQAKHIGKVVITLPPPLPEFPGLRPDATYLITGGLGDLGLRVAASLAERGARHLLLLGRNTAQLSADQQSAIQQLRDQGVSVSLVQADVVDAAALAIALQPWLSGTEPPLRGIVHAAGTLQDALIPNQTWASFERVMAAKVQGAWNLHHLTQDQPLDCFVTFSSIASLTGSPGQANYATANAFLDALAHYRQRQGYPGLSLNWGPWNAGMASRMADAEQRFAASGLHLIPPEKGTELLHQALQHATPQLGIIGFQWPKFAELQPDHNQAFFSEFAQIVPSANPTPEATTVAPPSGSTEFLKNLAGLAEGDRPTHLQQHIQDQLAKVMGFSDASAIDPQENFGDLGMDSLMAVELNNRLQASLGCPVSQGLLFDYPTITALATYLLENTLDLAAVEAAPTPTLPEPTAAQPAPIRTPQRPATTPQPNPAPPQTTLNSPPSPTHPPTHLPTHSPPPQPSPDLANIPPEHYQLDRLPEYVSLRQDLDRVARIGSPFFEVHDGIIRDTSIIHEQTVINYSSYNYIGMSGDPAVSQGAVEAIAQYGTSVSASRVVSGERPIHRELEQGIADFLGTEDCIVYIGGHATNVSTIGHLMGANDLILCDALSHNSIREGCKMSGATVLDFPHNDVAALAQLLQTHRCQYQKVLIAIEGIYSTDGDIAPLKEIVELKKAYKTLLLVDEAHSIGVLGVTGRGIGEEQGIAPADVDLWMGTLSKSFASCGGYIAGGRAIVEYLKYTAPGFVFSVGMTPANAGAAIAALHRLKEEPWRVATLKARSHFFLQLAKQRGFNTGTSYGTPIIPIIVGEPNRAVYFTQVLMERGINARPMVYPSVPFNAARLRFFITSLHSEDQIRHTLDVLAEEWPRVQSAPL